jgi:hypothetical protein
MRISYTRRRSSRSRVRSSESRGGGYLALARRDDDVAADRFAATIELLRGWNVETLPEVFVDLVRSLISAGRATEANA